MVNTVEKMIANTFLTMAKGLESGSFGERPKIAVTGMGSEHGEENVMEAAKKQQELELMSITLAV